MSSNTEKEKPARSPTYSEVAKFGRSQRLAPLTTDFARGGNGSPGTSGSPSSGHVSFGKTPSTGATSLYSPGVWSPLPTPTETQSAAMPKKLSWAQALNQGAKTFSQVPQSPARQHFKPYVGSVTSPKSAALVGTQFGNLNIDTDVNGNTSGSTAHGLKNTAAGRAAPPAVYTGYSYQQHQLSAPQLSPHIGKTHDSNANTFPLMQHEFGTSRNVADQPRMFSSPFQSGSYGTADGSGTDAALNSSHLATTAAGKGEADTARSDITNPYEQNHGVTSAGRDIVDAELRVASSVMSALQAHGPTEKKVVEQATHPDSFERQTRFKQQRQITEAFPGSLQFIQALNSSHWQLPAKCRIICIKTEFPENIQWAVKNSSWAAMKKVGDRINAAWDARESEDEKILLLYSVNGQKSYCGLAEMQGPFDVGGNMEGWLESEEGSQGWGTIPTKWEYVKNVCYYWFNDIFHAHNGQPIVNMWNGMHFPAHTGRRVVEIFVQRPHFTNVVAWFNDGPYNPHKANINPTVINPDIETTRQRHGGGGLPAPPQRRMVENVRALRNDRDGGQSSHRAAANDKQHSMMGSNWRQPPKQGGKVLGEINEPALDAAPVGRHGSTNNNATPIPSSFRGLASPSPRPGETVQCVADINGNYVPVSAAIGSAHRLGANTRGGNQAGVQQIFHATAQQLRAMQPAVQPAQFNAPRGRGGFRGGNQGFHGARTGSFSPVRGGGYFGNNDRSYMGSPTHHGGFPNDSHNTPPPQHTPGQSMTPTVHRMRSQLGMDDSLSTPRNVHEARSMGHLTPLAGNMQSPSSNTAAFQRAVSTANFVPQTALIRQDSTISNATTHQATPVIYNVFNYHFNAPATPTTNAVGNSGDSVGLGIQNMPATTPPVKGTMARWAEGTMQAGLMDENSISVMTPPSDLWDQARGASLGETSPRSESERESCHGMTPEKMRIHRKRLGRVAELSRRRYMADPFRTQDHQDDLPRPEGSEAGGLQCWVSTSSLEKRKISPLPSLTGAYDNVEAELEARAIADVDELMDSETESEKESEKSSEKDGGVAL